MLESEALLKLEIWPAWILLFCSLLLLLAAFARAFSGELRRFFFSRESDTAHEEGDSNPGFLEAIDP